MHAHRTITRLAALVVTAAVAAPAASAQAHTLHHLIAHDEHRRTGPLAPARRTAPKPLRPCIGSGPLARPGEFTSYGIHPLKRSSAAAVCIGVIED
jgi:hypothetical protein